MSEIGAEQKGRFKVKNVSRVASEDASKSIQVLQPTQKSATNDARESPAQFKLDDSLTASSSPAPSEAVVQPTVADMNAAANAKKKSRFIVKTVTKEDDDDYPHYPTISVPAKVKDATTIPPVSSSNDTAPETILVKMEQLMRANTQIMQQFLEAARSMPTSGVHTAEPRTVGNTPQLVSPIVTSAMPLTAAPTSLSTALLSTTQLSSASDGVALTPTARGAPVIEGAKLSSKLAAVSATAAATSAVPTKPTVPPTVSHPVSNTVQVSTATSSQPSATAPNAGSASSIAPVATTVVAAAVSTDEKDAHFSKMSHYLLELKRELDAVQKQRKDKHLETQRLREKCQQLEEKLQSSARKTQRLEEQQASHQGVVDALQGQVVTLTDTVSRLTAELAHLRLRSPIVVSPTTTEDGGLQHSAQGPAGGQTTLVETVGAAGASAAPLAAVNAGLPTNCYPSDGSIYRSDSNKTGTSSLPDAASNSNLQDYFMGTPPVSPPQASHKGILLAAHTLASAQQAQCGQQQSHHASPNYLPQGIPVYVPVPPPIVVNTSGPHSVAAALIGATSPVMNHKGGSVGHNQSHGGASSIQTEVAADGLIGPGHPLIRTKSISQAPQALQGSQPGTPLTAQQAAVLQMQQMVDNAVNNINTSNTSAVSTAPNKQVKAVGAEAGTSSAKYTASGYNSGTATPTYRPNSANPAVTGPAMQAAFLVPQPSQIAPPQHQGAQPSHSQQGIYQNNRNLHGAGQNQLAPNHASSHPYNPLQIHGGGHNMQGNAFQPMHNAPSVSHQYAPQPHGYSLEARLYNNNLPSTSNGSGSGSPACQVNPPSFHGSIAPHINPAMGLDMFNTTPAATDVTITSRGSGNPNILGGNHGSTTPAYHNSTTSMSSSAVHDELDCIAARPSNNSSDFLSIDATSSHSRPS